MTPFAARGIFRPPLTQGLFKRRIVSVVGASPASFALVGLAGWGAGKGESSSPYSGPGCVSLSTVSWGWAASRTRARPKSGQSVILCRFARQCLDKTVQRSPPLLFWPPT